MIDNRNEKNHRISGMKNFWIFVPKGGIFRRHTIFYYDLEENISKIVKYFLSKNEQKKNHIDRDNLKKNGYER
jgi:hypothetical protein